MYMKSSSTVVECSPVPVDLPIGACDDDVIPTIPGEVNHDGWRDGLTDDHIGAQHMAILCGQYLHHVPADHQEVVLWGTRMGE